MEEGFFFFSVVEIEKERERESERERGRYGDVIVSIITGIVREVG